MIVEFSGGDELFVLARLVVLELLDGTRPVKITGSIGNLSGRKWVLKKWIVKMKPAASSASSLWMIVATLIDQPGRMRVKNSGNQSRSPVRADDRHAPEHREVVELLPVGAAAVLRPRAEAEEPLDGLHELLDVAGREQQSSRSHEDVQPGHAPGLLAVQHVPEVHAKPTEQDDRADAVEVAHGVEAAEHPEKRLAQPMYENFSAMPGQRQGEEAEHHHEVQCRGEAVNRRNSLVSRRPGPCGAFHSSRSATAEQPGQGVEHREGQGADQQDGHAPEGLEQPRILVLVVVRGVGQVAGEAAVRAAWHWPQVSTTLSRLSVEAGSAGRQDVVRAVAVVALGGAVPTEPRDLAVEGVEEGLRLLLVAASALVHHA